MDNTCNMKLIQDGIVEITFSNCIGKVYKVDRVAVSDDVLLKLEEHCKHSVIIMVGNDRSFTTVCNKYTIGRYVSYASFWNNIKYILVATPIDTGSICYDMRYLEHRVAQYLSGTKVKDMSKVINQYNIHTDIMNNYFDCILNLLDVLSIGVNKRLKVKKLWDTDIIVYLHRDRYLDTVDAVALYHSDGSMTIKCGSIVIPYESGEYRIDRLRECTNCYERTVFGDVVLDNPSITAAYCLGYNANGWTEWKDKNGRTLNELVTKRPKRTRVW